MIAIASVLALLVMVVDLVRGDGRGPRPAPAPVANALPANSGPPGTKPILPGFGPLLLSGPLPAASKQQAALDRYKALGLPIFCGGTQHKYLALTFDDGPGPQTEKVMRMLSEAGQRATFFTIGREVPKAPNLPRQAALSGAVGNHTFNHPDLTKLDRIVMASELQQGKDALEAATGQQVQLFRPPYGARNQAVDLQIAQLGMLDVVWDVDTQDAIGATAPQVIDSAKEGMKRGAIILMHENRPQTLVALPRILKMLQRKAYRSVTIPELLALNPPSDELVTGGFIACFRAEKRTDTRVFGPTGA
ncbi:MAG: peptidoglycan-N-acetylglucosamine deacetylase [Solirubrobacteraceae bacterium]|nr:peptidoglycan-N-acetylglucosamine deacetylase [Solirubrobacteraceae bacterium]